MYTDYITCIYVHRLQTKTHLHTRTLINTHIHTDHTQVCTYVHIYLDRYTHLYTCSQTTYKIYTYTFVHTNTCTHIHRPHTHTCEHVHRLHTEQTHIHTQHTSTQSTHTHIYIQRTHKHTHMYTCHTCSYTFTHSHICIQHMHIDVHMNAHVLTGTCTHFPWVASGVRSPLTSGG